MPDNVRMSLTNGMALLVYALVAGVAYGAMQIKGSNTDVRVTNVELRVGVLEASDHKADLERQAYTINQQMLISQIGDIKDFIKSYEYKEADNGN